MCQCQLVLPFFDDNLKGAFCWAAGDLDDEEEGGGGGREMEFFLILG
jgi:hypothetical protein